MYDLYTKYKTLGEIYNMNKKPKYYVYMHKYKGIPTYIGVGTINKYNYEDRAKNFTNRNNDYLDFIREVGRENIEVEIIARFDDREDAITLEEKLHSIHTAGYLFSISDSQVKKQISILKSIPVVQMTLDNKFVSEHPNSLVEGFDSSAIRKCCKKQRKNHKGYRWLYKEDYERMCS